VTGASSGHALAFPVPSFVAARDQYSHANCEVNRAMFEATRQLNGQSSASSDSVDAVPGDRDLQRANAAGRIVLRGSDSGTEVVDVYQRFPTRIMLPTIDDDTIKEAVVVNAAGGIAGGDRLEFEVTALGNSRVTVTSQAAEKIYRALDRPGRILTRLKARDTARLAWLPQETIIFNSARVHRQMEIDLSPGTQLVALEWLVLGRTAHGEEVTRGYICDRWLVRRDGRLVWADSFRVADETFPHLRRRALLSNYNGIGTLLYFGPHLERRLEMLRDVTQSLACSFEATMVSGLIVVRLAAEASSDLRISLICMLQHLGREGDPRPFRVPKMWLC
jgi:urease accessory protein